MSRGGATARFSWFVARFVPSPFVFALLLTAVAFALGLCIGRPPGQGVVARGGDLLLFWYGREKSPGGFVASGGFAFALQMCLVLATGHALASAPPVARWLRCIDTSFSARAGLTLNDRQSAILLESAPYALAMAERIRKPRARMEEPALVFRFPN